MSVRTHNRKARLWFFFPWGEESVWSPEESAFARYPGKKEKGHEKGVDSKNSVHPGMGKPPVFRTITGNPRRKGWRKEEKRGCKKSLSSIGINCRLICTLEKGRSNGGTLPIKQLGEKRKRVQLLSLQKLTH